MPRLFVPFDAAMHHDYARGSGSASEATKWILGWPELGNQVFRAPRRGAYPEACFRACWPSRISTPTGSGLRG